MSNKRCKPFYLVLAIVPVVYCVLLILQSSHQTAESRPSEGRNVRSLKGSLVQIAAQESLPDDVDISFGSHADDTTASTEALLNASRSIVAHAPFLLFTLVNGAYAKIMDNWMCNVRHMSGVLNRTLVAVTDGPLAMNWQKKWPQVHFVHLPINDSRTGNGKLIWGRRGYISFLNYRALLLSKLLEFNVSYVLFEPDAIWFKNPLDFFHRYWKDNAGDVIVPVKGYFHKQFTLAFDPMLLKPRHSTKQFFAEMNRQLAANGALYDQDILDTLCKQQFAGTVCQTFEWNDIGDGKWFHMPNNKQIDPYIVNNNYIVGVDKKITRQALLGLWYLKANGDCIVAKSS